MADAQQHALTQLQFPCSNCLCYSYQSYHYKKSLTNNAFWAQPQSITWWGP